MDAPVLSRRLECRVYHPVLIEERFPGKSAGADANIVMVHRPGKVRDMDPGIRDLRSDERDYAVAIDHRRN